MPEPISYLQINSQDNKTIHKAKIQAQTDKEVQMVADTNNHLNRDKVETSSLGSSDKESIAISESFWEVWKTLFQRLLVIS